MVIELMPMHCSGMSCCSRAVVLLRLDFGLHARPPMDSMRAIDENPSPEDAAGRRLHSMIEYNNCRLTGRYANGDATKIFIALHQFRSQDRRAKRDWLFAAGGPRCR